MRRAFTLVEALVAIAIIGLLLGVLLPALGGARSSARLTQCASSARQLQVGNLAYAADHKDRFVAGAVGIDSAESSANLHRWHGSRLSVVEPFDPAKAPLSRYVDGAQGSIAIRMCDEFANDLDEAIKRGDGFERGCGGYGYNQAFVGVVRTETQPGVWTSEYGSPRGARQDQFDRPEGTVAFADSAFAGDFGLIEYSFIEPPLHPQFPPSFGYRPDPSLHFRHRGKATVVWLDGHATAETRTFSAWSQLYSNDPARFNLGWFGDPEDGNEAFDYE